MQSPERNAHEPYPDEEDDILNRYDFCGKIGEGTYGKVFQAKRRGTEELVAIKKIRIAMDEDGVPSTALREITLLKEVDSHPNVVTLIEVCTLRLDLCLVFEHCDMDLRSYLRTHDKLRGGLLRFYSLQLVLGLEHCHSRRVLHRDLKPQNVLVDLRGMRLLLADFGLARAFTVPLRVYTHEVVTLWYRAPEILLGQARYGPGMDIWSLGCIIAEMATAQALFPGDSEIDTIYKIFRCLGTPTDQVWPGVSTLKDFKHRAPKWRGTDFADVRRHACPSFGDAGVEVLRNCLEYDSVNRMPAKVLKTFAFFEGGDAAHGLSRGA